METTTHAEHPPRGRHSKTSRRAVWATAGAALVIALTLLALKPGSRSALVGSDALTLAFALVAVGATFHAAHRTDRRERRGFLWLGFAMTAFAVAEGSWFVHEVALLRDVPYPGWTDAAYFLGYALVVTALVAFVAERARFPRLVEHLMDIFILTLSFLVILWPWLLRPLYQASDVSMLEWWVSIGYPLADVAVAALAIVILTRLRPDDARSVAWVATGIAVWIVGDIAFTYLSLIDAYRTGGLLDVAWPIGYLVIACGALVAAQASAPSARAAESAPSPHLLIVGHFPVALAAVVGVVDYVQIGTLGPVLFTLAVLLFLLLVARLTVTGVSALHLNQRLVAANAGLERRVSERTAALAEANLRLQRETTAKTAFLNTVSHELRTPLTPSILQVDLLMDERHGPLSAEQKRSLLTVQRSLARLEDILKRTTEVAAAQHRGLILEIEQVHLADVVELAVESYRRKAEERGVGLHVDIEQDSRLEGDRVFLTRAFANIIDNAIRFSDRDGQVWIRVFVHGATASVIVRDEGIGMDPGRLAEIVEPFRHGHDPRETARLGPGLGLFLAKTIVAEHGGKIHAKTAGPGTGMEVRVDLPATGAMLDG